MLKTILVTGSNGLLGQKITELAITNKDINLIATSKGANRFVEQQGYQYLEMDILDFDAVARVLQTCQPDVLIHTAAMTNVDTCHTNQEECLALNVKATASLISLCEKLNIQFIYLSTDFVFDGLNGPYKEGDATNPVSFYGESKLQGELLTQQMNGSWAIIRTILVYGISNDMGRSNIVLWAKGALEKGAPINVVNDQFRMPTLAEDLAEACLLAATKGAEGVYHISGQEMMTIVDIVRQVASFWDLDQSKITEVSSASLGQEAKRPLKTGFVLDKAMAELDFQPHTFAEGLAIVKQQLAVLSR
jgi:dTDP-4-dehydrorhamnose reductase